MWLFFAHQALAGPAELSGTWSLDREASDDVGALLEARGYPWVLRQAAQHSQVTQTFTFSGDELNIHVVTSLRESNDLLLTNGARQTRTTDRGEAAEYWTRWSDDALVTTSVITSSDGQVARFIVSRRVEADGAVLRQTMTYQPPDGRVLSADRVFRRP